ncbi:serine/threonine-protein kinase [Nostoc sp. 106C]|uniref:serine/threonine-protein kinase n=1 Tax=Nostoc sp. 106C TaxID=1932667 RepID=UPI000A3BAB7F|nr:serine/threonine-protein kinase [Nostoc sp. 106C]OUL34930.1 serine/threonine protein kinase [Nostoc sp. 106C]
MLGSLLDGRYQVLQVLGGGGFGQTYIAQDTHRPGSPRCVVKHLKPFTQNPEFLSTARRLFTSEAETLEKLGNHDQIPRLLAYFEENQEFFLVQEFIQGYSLKAELLPGRRWTEEQVVQLLQQVLGILEFVHSHKVIHRDIKPDNIIRRQHDCKLVLIDFGAVKQIQTQLRTAISGHIETTIAIGTPGYMATEQGQGKPRPNSDIYSLGIIGIQALTGLHPRQLQEDPNTGEIFWQHEANISPCLASVLSKMVLYHFKERYQSATEVLEALQSIDIDTEIDNQFTQPPLSVIQLPQATLPQQNTTGQSTASILSPEQYKHLEKMLLELVGPLAPTLLRKIATSASNYQDVIDNLTQHLAGNQRTEFQEKSMLIFRETTSQPESKPNIVPTTETPAISDSFVRRCEQELVNLIGPIGTFLVQKAIKSFPQISHPELVKLLSSQIPDPQKALQFQQRLLS